MVPLGVKWLIFEIISEIPTLDVLWSIFFVNDTAKNIKLASTDEIDSQYYIFLYKSVAVYPKGKQIHRKNIYPHKYQRTGELGISFFF